jgi:hypothetical protein
MLKIAFDESGTIGKKERYFVIAALITRNDASKKRIGNLVKHTKAGFTSPAKRAELKGSLLTTPQKQRFLNSLTSIQDFQIAYLVADKNHLDPKIYAQKNLTFNFLFGVLLKSFIRSFPEDIELCIDNRTVKVTSRNSLEDYIQIEAYTKWNFEHDLNIHLEDSKSDNLLQAVDVIANTIWAKYNYNTDHLYNTCGGYFIRKQHFPYTKFGS